MENFHNSCHLELLEAVDALVESCEEMKDGRFQNMWNPLGNALPFPYVDVYIAGGASSSTHEC